MNSSLDWCFTVIHLLAFCFAHSDHLSHTNIIVTAVCCRVCHIYIHVAKLKLFIGNPLRYDSKIPVPSVAVILKYKE